MSSFLSWFQSRQPETSHNSDFLARVAVLEVQLQQAKDDRDVTEKSASFLLRLASGEAETVASRHVAEFLYLEAKVKKLDLENQSLRDQIAYSHSQSRSQLQYDSDTVAGTESPELKGGQSFHDAPSNQRDVLSEQVSSIKHQTSDIIEREGPSCSSNTRSSNTPPVMEFDLIDLADINGPRPLQPVLPVFGHEHPQPTPISNNGPSFAQKPCHYSLQVPGTNSRVDSFATDMDRERAILQQKRDVGPGDSNIPEFFRYGIRYYPSPGQTDTRHRVIITNLPLSITYGELFSIVRGGLVVSCQILDTIELLGFKSAMVRFLDERAAMAYSDYAAAHPIYLGERRVKVTIIDTPSYPVKAQRLSAIVNCGHTRSLEAKSFPFGVYPEQAIENLMWDMRSFDFCEQSTIAHVERCDGDTLILQLTNTSSAGSAYGILTEFRAYAGCDVRFLPDPCEQPVETIHRGGHASDREETDDMRVFALGPAGTIRRKTGNARFQSVLRKEMGLPGSMRTYPAAEEIAMGLVSPAA